MPMSNRPPCAFTTKVCTSTQIRRPFGKIADSRSGTCNATLSLRLRPRSPLELVLTSRFAVTISPDISAPGRAWALSDVVRVTYSLVNLKSKTSFCRLGYHRPCMLPKMILPQISEQPGASPGQVSYCGRADRVRRQLPSCGQFVLRGLTLKRPMA